MKMAGMLERFREWLSSSAADQDPQARERGLRRATALLLAEIARADGTLDASERASMVDALHRGFGIARAEAAELVEAATREADAAVSLHEYTRELNDALELPERVHIIEMLWQVAAADGRIDRYEEYYIRKLADLLYVPHVQFVRARHRVLG